MSEVGSGEGSFVWNANLRNARLFATMIQANNFRLHICGGDSIDVMIDGKPRTVRIVKVCEVAL